MRGAVGRYTIFFVALGLVLWAYQTKMQPPPEGPELPDHPLILAKLESEELLNDGLKIARALLIQDGEFKPFASGLTEHREVERVAGMSRSERSSFEIVEMLERSLRDEAEERSYRAIAIVSDVRYEIEGDSTPRTAVQVTLEHREGYCVDVIARYTQQGDTLEYDRLLASPRQGRVFDTCYSASQPLPPTTPGVRES